MLVVIEALLDAIGYLIGVPRDPEKKAHRGRRCAFWADVCTRVANPRGFAYLASGWLCPDQALTELVVNLE